MNPSLSCKEARVRKILQRSFGVLLRRETEMWIPKGCLVTLASVRLSPTLREAFFYISIYPIRYKEEVFQNFNRQKARIKGDLATHVSQHLARLPDIVFVMDDAEERSHRVRELMRSSREGS
ncbi:MAG: ribosome-binding factor A [Cytophagales bacterium]|nr:ribosome-binding factor A [Cytophagales bacterium]